MKSVVAITLLLIASTYAQGCGEVKAQCSSVGESCTTQTACTVCLNTLTACSLNASNTLCGCYSAYVNCAAAAKSPFCPSEAIYYACTESLDNCTCGTPSTATLDYNICNAAGFCENSTASCVALKTVGQSCTEDDQCGSGNNDLFTNQYECTNGKCAQVNTAFAYPNDNCNTNTDCYYYTSEGLGCENGVCKGTAIGSSCNDDAQCVYGAFCNSTINQCKANFAAGAACSFQGTYADVVCGANMVCGGTKTCIKYFSSASGTKCNSGSECSQGLACNNGTCGSQLPAMACANTTVCKNANAGYLSCDCGQCTMNKPLDSTCNSNYLSALDCLAANQCSQNSGPQSGSCLVKNCADQVQCYYACAQDVSGSGVCPASTVNCPSGGAGVISYSVALLVAVIAALMF